MLFVYYRETEVPEYDVVLDQGVGSDYDSDAAVFKTGMDLPSFGNLAASGQQGGLYASRCEEFLYVLIVLLCKDFRRGHYACLKAVSDGDKCGQYCDHGLSAADISLKQAVHLMTALHVVPDLGYHAFLCPCQREWKGIVAEVECFSDPWHDDTLVSPASYVFLLEEG